MKKKEGIINNIVYDNTAYHNGEYRHYPTVTGLQNLIKEISESGSTTNLFRITPFYINSRVDLQIEFDEYMFYLECRDQFTDKDQKEHIGSCIGKEYTSLNNEEHNLGHILFPLCKHNDAETSKKTLITYLEFLEILLPKLLDRCKKELNLENDDLAFGYFCFEVHSD